jgi:hypothetical protein
MILRKLRKQYARKNQITPIISLPVSFIRKLEEDHGKEVLMGTSLSVEYSTELPAEKLLTQLYQGAIIITP